jgi:hypothetical protein
MSDNKETSSSPPPVLDSARVLQYATLERGIEFSGRSLLFVDGKELGAVPCFAIFEEKTTGGVLLFHCTSGWNVLGCSAHKSLSEAQARAEAIYKGISTRWIDVSISREATLKSGSHDAYRWLTTTAHDFDSLLTLCPTAVIGKYLAVTAFDSGSLSLSDEEKASGWESRKGISYSPLIESVGTLPERGGFDEWYVFGAPVDLGEKGQGNIFEAPLLSGQIEVFVNFAEGFDLYRPNDLAPLFWRQLKWIRPESYIADTHQTLTFVSANRNVFEAVRQALTEHH